MPHDVFICHSSADKVVADAACAALEAQAIRCWIAPRDVLPGAVWAQSIHQAIKASRVMVLIYSRRVNHSNQIVRELERAVNGGLAILPFRIEDAPPSGAIEYFIGSSHWLDALTEPLEQYLDKLCRSVKALLGSLDGWPATDGEGSARRAVPFARGWEKPESDQDGYAAAVRAKSVVHLLRKRLQDMGARLTEGANRADSRSEAAILEKVGTLHGEMLASPRLFEIDISIESGDTMLRDRRWREALPVLTEAAAAIERLIQRIELEEPRLRAQARADEVGLMFHSKREVETALLDSARQVLDGAEADLARGDNETALAGFERARSMFSDAADALPAMVASKAAEAANAKASDVADYLRARSFAENNAYGEAKKRLIAGQKRLEEHDFENAFADLQAAHAAFDGIVKACEAAIEAELAAKASEQEAVDLCVREGLRHRQALEAGLSNLASGMASLKRGDFDGARANFLAARSDFARGIEETRALLDQKREAVDCAQMAQTKKAELDRVISDGGLADSEYSHASDLLEAGQHQLQEEDFKGASRQFQGATQVLERALESARRFIAARQLALDVSHNARMKNEEINRLMSDEEVSGGEEYSRALSALKTAERQLQENDFEGAFRGFQVATDALETTRRFITTRQLALDVGKKARAKKEEIDRLCQGEGGRHQLMSDEEVSGGEEYSRATSALEAAECQLQEKNFAGALRGFRAAMKELEHAFEAVRGVIQERAALLQRVAEAGTRTAKALCDWRDRWHLGEDDVEDQRKLLKPTTLKSRCALAEALEALTTLYTKLEADVQRGHRMPEGWEATDPTPGIAGWATVVRDPRTMIEFRLVSPGSFLMGTPGKARSNSIDIQRVDIEVASPSAGTPARPGLLRRLWAKTAKTVPPPADREPPSAREQAGESEWERANERPQHEVRLTQPFYLAVTPTTRSQWGRVESRVLDPPVPPNEPITRVARWPIEAFCRSCGYRLPTEAEWEYACRAGETSSSQPLGSVAWHSEFLGRDTPHAVAEKEPNPWGFYDMLGNVWEWCADTYDERAYCGPQRVDPVVRGSSTYGVARGGSFRSPLGTVRCAYRRMVHGNTTDSDIGFRCVKDL